MRTGISFTVSATEQKRLERIVKDPKSPGGQVRKLQEALKIDAGGIYGEQTERAVRSIQERHGLDGMAGPQTLASIPEFDEIDEGTVQCA